MTARLEDDVLTTAPRGWLAIHPARTGETKHPRGYPTPKEITTQCGHGPFGRRQAEVCGLRYYYTGTPCPEGHDDVRHVSLGCISCHLQRWRDPEWRERERARVRDAVRRHRARRKLQHMEDELEQAGIYW